MLTGLEGTPELTGELALFNKVGDLYLKVSKVPEAVEMYERAVNLYSENGFPNNAIALCNKILRNAPGRTHIYLKLAQLMVERGFVAEAKQNLLEYADRMQKAGKTDEAFRALKEFADLSPDNEEIRLLLAEQLKAADRDHEAREQLAKLYAEAQASGDVRRSRGTLDNIKAIDPEFDEESAAKTKVKAKKQKSSDLVFLDVEYDTDSAAAPEVAEVEDEEVEEEAAVAVEPADVDEAPAVDDLPAPDTELEISRASADSVSTEAETDAAALDGLDVAAEFEAPAGADVESLELEPTSLAIDEPAVEEAPAPAPAVADELELADEVEEPVAAPSEPELVEVDADDDLELEPVAAGDADIEVPDLDLGDGLDDEVDFGDADLDLGADLEETAEPAGVTAATDEPVAADVEEDEFEDLSLDEEADEEPVAAVVAPAPEEPDVEALEAAVAEDPDDPTNHVALGEALVGTGKRERGLEELGIAVALYEARQEWARGAGVVDEILRVEPGSMANHQKRVELAYRIGDKSQLVQAYVAMADALFRDGAIERSRAVYRRVLEHDPENAHAKDALETFEAAEAETAVEEAPAAAEAGADYVDLGALVMEDEPVRDTRMRVEDEEPTGDEERDFAEMLSQFKRGIEENIEDEDWQAHYDLGIAFKEMGLLDEAVAEFQKALRSPAGRLRTAEALGNCFYEKNQYSVAATVMRRAVESDSSGDQAKIGLLYWLGRCEEEQQRVPEALVYYQRVFALDINFQDVSDRVKALARAGS